MKSEREKQVLYINAYVWNLEKCYSWTYLQGRNRDADVENTSGHGRVGGAGWTGRWEWTCARCPVWNKDGGDLTHSAGSSAQLDALCPNLFWIRIFLYIVTSAARVLLSRTCTKVTIILFSLKSISHISISKMFRNAKPSWKPLRSPRVKFPRPFIQSTKPSEIV